MVLFLTLGGIGVPLLCLRPMAGIHLFLMTLYVESSLTQDVLAMKAIGAAILVSWLLNVAVRRTVRLNFNALTISMALLVSWCGVTMLFAEDTHEALLRTFQFLQLAVAALMFGSVLDSVAKVRSVCAAIVLWTGISTIIALFMYYAGMTSVAQGLVLNRNALAMYVIVAIICAYVLYQASESPLLKAVYLSTFPIFFLGVALTLSRTGLIMLVLALLLVWFRLARERRFFVIGSTLAVLCLVSVFLPDVFWHRADTIVPAIERQQDTFGLRVRIWKVGLEMVRDHPITGVGAGNFLLAFGRYAHGRFLWRHLSPHNTFVGMAAETGLVGLSLLVLVLLFGMTTARGAMRLGGLAGNAGVRFFAVVAEVSIFTQVVGCFTGDGESLKILWVMFGMALSLKLLGRESMERLESVSSARRHEAIPVGAAAWAPVR